ncbi:MAG TPA: bifunctional diaminohydroxyphosphoribosylaminopyrimidine deaminase/5-amino-6-(5-phosphoribosylamino)uracil reductase RibD [Candidatus Omnitrophota bacterium]|nr:bifunctional diaminohydroxyphosphoribosylaminopyrimidine deaminase/5-amino-6-(5-phosphoribosylamino)uracil reductase RibD [Candidatus Omnitrophota bacterium]
MFKSSLVLRYMRIALKLAEKAEGATFPNPCVGCIIVKDNKIIGRGFHRKAGFSHAEVVALKSAGNRARGASLFCTFEPCAHFGRTGPCVDQIIKAGIKEVYIGMIDPNPLTRGKSIIKLKKSGIKVSVGYLQDEISKLNRPFIKAMTKGIPLVTIKIAESIDGKTATSSGESKWITSGISRKYSHDRRCLFDAIMVGSSTLLKDDPGLECSDKAHNMAKIVVDSDLKTPPSARIFKTKQKVLIAAVRKNALKEERLKNQEPV